jgi:hypothetical protein
LYNISSIFDKKYQSLLIKEETSSFGKVGFRFNVSNNRSDVNVRCTQISYLLKASFFILISSNHCHGTIILPEVALHF